MLSFKAGLLNSEWHREWSPWDGPHPPVRLPLISHWRDQHTRFQEDKLVINVTIWTPEMWPSCYFIKWMLGLAPRVSLPIQTHPYSRHFGEAFINSLINSNFVMLKAGYAANCCVGSFHVLHMWDHRSHYIIGYSGKPCSPETVSEVINFNLFLGEHTPR